MTAVPGYDFETLSVTSPMEYVYEVTLNRPEKRNAINTTMFKDIRDCFNLIAQDGNCRAVVLSGSGRIFSSGIDLTSLRGIAEAGAEQETSRRAMHYFRTIPDGQACFSAIEKCPKPVIAAVHGMCLGAGVDLIATCDIRYASREAIFRVQEVDMGIAADVGTLQRLPKIVGNDSLARELVYSARRFQSDEALQLGLLSQVFADRDACVNSALKMAELIASKSPVAVAGSKVNLIFSRDHSVQEGLDFIAVWNQGMLQSEDVMKAAMASMQKQKPSFSKL